MAPFTSAFKEAGGYFAHALGPDDASEAMVAIEQFFKLKVTPSQIAIEEGGDFSCASGIHSHKG